MNIPAFKWCRGIRLGDPAAKSVLRYLCERVNAKGFCWPSQTTIAEDTDLDRKTVQRKLKRLEDLGLITRVARKNSRGRDTDYIYLNIGTSAVIHVQSEGGTASPTKVDRRGAQRPLPGVTESHESTKEPPLPLKSSTSPSMPGITDYPRKPDGSIDYPKMVFDRAIEWGKMSGMSGALARKRIGQICRDQARSDFADLWEKMGVTDRAEPAASRFEYVKGIYLAPVKAKQAEDERNTDYESLKALALAAGNSNEFMRLDREQKGDLYDHSRRVRT